MSPLPHPASLELSNLTKAWGDTTAVNEIDLSVEGGSFTVLLGPSGCGKSTTLRLIAGLEEATSGQISIGGKDVTSLSSPARYLYGVPELCAVSAYFCDRKYSVWSQGAKSWQG